MIGSFSLQSLRSVPWLARTRCSYCAVSRDWLVLVAVITQCPVIGSYSFQLLRSVPWLDRTRCSAVFHQLPFSSVFTPPPFSKRKKISLTQDRIFAFTFIFCDVTNARWFAFSIAQAEKSRNVTPGTKCFIKSSCFFSIPPMSILSSDSSAGTTWPYVLKVPSVWYCSDPIKVCTIKTKVGQENSTTGVMISFRPM